MPQIPVLSRTTFSVYWNGFRQPGISFNLNDAIIEALKVYNAGINCGKNDVTIVSSYGTIYKHNSNDNSFSIN